MNRMVFVIYLIDASKIALTPVDSQTIYPLPQLGTACAVVANVLVVFNEALNQVRIKILLQTITTSCLIAGLVLTANWGLVVAAIAVSISRVVFLAGQILIAARAIKIDPVLIIKALFPGVMIGASIFATLKMIEYSPQWQQAPVLV
jgi:hypothetical protein